MSDCLFCSIAGGDLSADIVAEGDDWLAFRDIKPQAPLHVLVIPRRHIATLNDVEDKDADLIGGLVAAAKRIAAKEGVAEEGYRLVFNTNAGSGQTVFHIHLHLLGGRSMGWPPG